MKNKGNFKTAILTFFGIIFGLSSFAQYTLQDGDVEVVDGVIISCSYAGAETSIVIPETLDGQTVIGIDDQNYIDGVFVGMGITEVQLPSSLEYIGDCAFYQNDIANIDFSACPNLERIGVNAFTENILTSVDLSDNSNLVIIESGAFFNQDSGNSLTSVDLSGCTSLVTIEGSAFSFNEISSVSFNSCSALQEIGYAAFSSNELNLVNISSCTSLIKIGHGAFNSNNLAGFSLPENQEYSQFGWIDENGTTYDGGDYVTDFTLDYWVPVTYTIQDSDVTIVDGVIMSFSYDYYETSITIPETLQGQTVIGIADEDAEGVFEGNGITEIHFPATMQFIGDRAFRNNQIVSLDLSQCPQLMRIGEFAFESNSLDQLVIHNLENLNLIDNYAFRNNNLDDINLSNNTSLTNIGTDAFANNSSGSYSTIDFTDCSALVSIGSGAFETSQISDIVFDGCTSLTTIKSGAFMQNLIDEVDFSALSSLEVIESSTFAYNNITDVNFENCISLITISYYAFSENTITEISLPDNPSNPYFYWRDSDGNTHSGGDVVSDFDLEYVMPVYILQDEDVIVVDAYITECLIDFPIAETHLVIPDILDSQPIYGIADGIGVGVFEDKDIWRINLPSTIKKVGDLAFKGNVLTSFVMAGNANLLQIGVEAFADNQLTTLNVNAYALAVIDEYAFAGNQLTEVDFISATALRVIGDYAFVSNQIHTLTINNADQLQYIGEYAFALNSLVSFTLPTPDIPGYNFNNWSGTGGSTHAGGTSVSNLNLGYLANLTTTGNSVTFNVSDGSNPIEGAYVTLEMHGTLQTNASGLAIFESVDDAEYNYTVDAYNFDEEVGSVNVSGSTITENVSLNQSVYDVRLYFSDGISLLSGITINFDGIDYTSNGSGYVLIQSLASGIYDYSIIDESYLPVSGQMEVVAVDVEQTIELTQIYTVNFTVTDGLGFVEGANVNFEGVDYLTNASGFVSITGLSQGTYNYSVSAENHLTESGQVIISNENISQEVELVSVYSITFTVTDGVDPISGANVNVDGVDYVCNASGVVIVNDLLYGQHIYTVSAEDFETISNNINLIDDININIELSPAYQVEFYISNGAIPVENAELQFNGETYYSNVAGFITIENVTADTYAYQVSASGFQVYTGSLTVIDDDVTEMVSLNSVGVEHINTVSISVYPNPTVGQLFFDGLEDNVKIEIYNLAGQMMCETYRDFDFSIDISDYPAGTYVIRLIPANSNMVIKRIVKE